MKKRDIAIDLTAFLDVILILMFFALMQNAGGIIEYRTQLYEIEAQVIILQQEQDELEYALADANERLLILSDWDNERAALVDELDTLSSQHSIMAEAANFVFLHMNIDDHRRVIAIETSPGIYYEIEVFWDGAGGNNIANESNILQRLSTVLSTLADAQVGSHPMLVMFSYSDRVARQEHIVITRGIRLLIDNSTHDFQIYYSVHRRN